MRINSHTTRILPNSDLNLIQLNSIPLPLAKATSHLVSQNTCGSLANKGCHSGNISSYWWCPTHDSPDWYTWNNQDVLGHTAEAFSSHGTCESGLPLVLYPRQWSEEYRRRCIWCQLGGIPSSVRYGAIREFVVTKLINRNVNIALMDRKLAALHHWEGRYTEN